MRRKILFLIPMLLFWLYSFSVNVEAISEENLGEILLEENNMAQVYEESELEVISPLYRVHNQAYGSFAENSFPYSSQMELNIPIYDYSQIAQYVPRVYIMIPKGTKLVGGVSNLQIELDKYLMLNNNIKGGQLIASQLNNSSNGREVYQITPTEGTYVGGELQDRDLHLKVEAPGKHSGIDSLMINANKISEIEEYNILFFGYDKKNLTNVNGLNPIVDAVACGIAGSDLEVATSVSARNRQEISFYIQKIRDSYSLLNLMTGELIAEKSIVGDLGDIYNREGFINTVELWGLQPEEYAQDSLAMEMGDINGVEIFSTEARNPEETVEGNNYLVFVKQYAGDIEMRFVDLEGKDIAPKETLSGFVGQEYSVQAKEIQGWILEPELPENQNGVFSESRQIIIYSYDRKDGEPVIVMHLDENNNKLVEDEMLHGKVGLVYKTQERRIEGWEIKHYPVNVEGEFMEITQEVIYVYAAKSAPPTPKNEIKEHIKKDTVINKIKPAEKKSAVFPRTGEKNANQYNFIKFGLMLVLVSAIYFFWIVIRFRRN